MYQEQMQNPVILGARGSVLSRWQANFVLQQINNNWPKVNAEIKFIKTEGDVDLKTPLSKLSNMGVFTAELEQALLQRRIHIAVHSFKDMPIHIDPQIPVKAVTKREDPRDALISRSGYTLKTLPAGAKVGTSSTRRRGQILFLRPDLNPIDIRGNIDTRIKKALDPSGPYDAIVLAYAGLKRANFSHLASEIVDTSLMLPAPAQGALAVQCINTPQLIEIVSSLNDMQTFLQTQAEKAFLKGLGGGCSLPISALARIHENTITLTGSVTHPRGISKIQMEDSQNIDLSNFELSKTNALKLGENLATRIISKGADKLLLET